MLWIWSGAGGATKGNPSHSSTIDLRMFRLVSGCDRTQPHLRAERAGAFESEASRCRWGGSFCSRCQLIPECQEGC